MKKTLFMALAAIITLASCSKENGGTNDTTGKVALSVKIDMSKFSARSGDTPVTTLPDWDQLLLVVTDNAGAFVTEKLLTKTVFDALANGKVDLIEKSNNVKLIGGKVTAYITTIGQGWGVLSADTTGTKNLPTLATGQLDINNWQPSGAIKNQIEGKFVNVPYYGEATIAKIGVSHGHEQLEATVVVTPELGRIQVLNTPQSGGELNGYTVAELTVDSIYINKITSNSEVVDIRTKNSTVNVDSDTWYDTFYKTGKLVGMCDNGTDKGYQIFDGNTPHVIVRVKYKLTKDGTTAAEVHTGYLTITKFKYDTMSVFGDLAVTKGKIYNIDLAVLKPTYDKIGDDPYDNTVWHDLIATVTIAPWTIVAVTPEL